MKLRPLSDRIVVERIAGREQTEGGLYLPDSVKEKERPQLGLVLAVGPGKKTDAFLWVDGEKVAERQPLDLSVGDLVLFTRYCGHEQEIGHGLKVLVMSEADVLCVVERDPPADESVEQE